MTRGHTSVTKAAPAIETRDLRKVFGENIRAVDGLNLSIEHKSTYALLGPNGAGKTTVISILTTLIEPSGGVARINGFDVVRDAAKVRRELGVTFQEMVLDDALTGRQVLTYHGRLYGLRSSERRQRTTELLELVELTEAADRRCRGYSGGMKRRLELARALMTVPRVLFLDEPTLGLDPQGRARIWDYLGELKSRTDLTVFLTTHYLEEAYQLADRVGIMDRGRLVTEGTPDDLIDELGADTISIIGDGPRDKVADHLGKLEFVHSVSPVDGGILLGVESSSRWLAQVVSAAADSGFEVRDISVSKPDLGAVFFKYTGRELRDEVQA